MLSALSLLGKVVEFIARGLQSAQLTRAADKRGQSCRAMTRLYYLLVELSSLAGYMLRNAQQAVAQNDAAFLGYTFRDTKRRIQTTTNDFVETFCMLREALDIFAPDLVDALSAVMNWKFNLLWEISQYTIFEDDGPAVAVRRFKYLRPDERLLNLEIGAYAKSLTEGNATTRAEAFEWPETLLYSGRIQEAFDPAELSFVDVDEVRQFASMLERHKRVLDDGITALRNFLRETFTVDEVLYESVEIAPAWFQ
jgi:hypothetical protein